MKSSQLKEILDYILPCSNVKVYDVLAHDLLKIDSIKNYPAAFILNTDKHSNPGEHWVCLYYKTSKECFFFCSYGHSTKFYNFNFKPTIWNSVRFQSYSSSRCGEFCVVVLHQLSLNNSFKRALSLFNKSNTKQNDSFVRSYINKIYKLQENSKNHSGQKCVTLRNFKNEYKRKRKHVRS